MLALYGNELEYLLFVLMNTLLFYCFLSSLVHCVWVFNLFYLKFISCVPFVDRLISVIVKLRNQLTSSAEMILLVNRFFTSNIKKAVKIASEEVRITYPLQKITFSTRSLPIRGSLIGSKHSCMTLMAVLSLL